MNMFFDKALSELGPGVGYTGDIVTKNDFETKCYKKIGSELSRNPANFGCTWEELETKMASLKIEYDATQYQRDRQYPSIGDQLDMQYNDAVNGTTTWKDAIDAIKAKYPKPE